MYYAFSSGLQVLDIKKLDDLIGSEPAFFIYLHDPASRSEKIATVWTALSERVDAVIESFIPRTFLRRLLSNMLAALPSILPLRTLCLRSFPSVPKNLL